MVAAAVVLAACGEPAAVSGPGRESSEQGSPAAEQPNATSGQASQAAWRSADDGAAIVEADRIGVRMVDLTISSPAVGDAMVRLLLPAQFDAQPGRTWPVLYLLHGAGGSHLDWTLYTDVETLTASTDLLIVMPDGGSRSWYADAWNGGRGGPPMWETFHVTEMRQLLERNWGASDRRAVAGLSMGGLGAMSYLGRHPDLFVGAASFSGVLDPLGAGPIQGGSTAFGDPVAQVDNWKAHDPRYLVPAMKGHTIYVAYGDGRPGPLDSGLGEQVDETERWIQPQNQAFVAELNLVGVAATVDAYGPGTHSWPYWERGLHAALPLLLEALGSGS